MVAIEQSIDDVEKCSSRRCKKIQIALVGGTKNISRTPPMGENKIALILVLTISRSVAKKLYTYNTNTNQQLSSNPSINSTFVYKILTGNV